MRVFRAFYIIHTFFRFVNIYETNNAISKPESGVHGTNVSFVPCWLYLSRKSRIIIAISFHKLFQIHHYRSFADCLFDRKTRFRYIKQKEPQRPLKIGKQTICRYLSISGL